jgi:hypothetical protein
MGSLEPVKVPVIGLRSADSGDGVQRVFGPTRAVTSPNPPKPEQVRPRALPSGRRAPDNGQP